MSGHASLIKAPAILHDALSHLMSPQGSIRASSVATIKESVSAIEAFMNELAEVGFGYETCGYSEDNPLVLMGRKLKEAERKRDSIKKKVQIVCETLSGRRFIKSSLLTYQKFSIVVDVRNELTHPKASVLTISSKAITPPRGEQRILKRLKSYGFVCSYEASHDWADAVVNRTFAEWAHLSVVEMMIYVLALWPYPEAVDGYLELYGLDQYQMKDKTGRKN